MFEDAKVTIRSDNLKERQYNDQKKKDKHCRLNTTPIFADIGGGIVDHINILNISENYRSSNTAPQLNGDQLRCSGG